MELYIEKEFLDNFYLEFDEKTASASQKIVATILKEYAEVEWFIDCKIDSIELLESLKNDNPYFHARSIYSSPISVRSIKEHFFEKSKCEQTLIFAQNNEDWFDTAELKGAICFSLNNYKTKIESIIYSCHFKIDLSDQFRGWEFLSNLKNIPFNKIMINDGYILADKSTQKIQDNLIPILQNIIGKNYQQKSELEIYTKDLNPLQPGTFEQIKDEADKKLRRLNSVFANYQLKIKIISNTLQKGKYDFHDRLLYLNFLIIDSPKGFNLMPYKKSNSQITIETIFDKYTYNRIKNHKRMHTDYFEKIIGLETMEFKFS
jgi:hypothetical protein